MEQVLNKCKLLFLLFQESNGSLLCMYPEYHPHSVLPNWQRTTINFIQVGPLALALFLKFSLTFQTRVQTHTLEWSGVYLKEPVTPSKFLRSLMLNFKLQKKNHVELAFNSKIQVFVLMIMEKSLENMDTPRRCTKFILQLLESPDTSMCFNISVTAQSRGLPNLLSS